MRLAGKAVASGAGVVFAMGGDGLINEVLNGVADAPDVKIGVVPAGTMNVLARNLGIPLDPLLAAALAVKNSGSTRVSLSKANGRLFALSCGSGFDAEAAVRIEAGKVKKKWLGPSYFYMAAMRTFLGSYIGREPYLLCEGEFASHRSVMVTAVNSGPYAYCLGRPLKLTRACGVEGKLGMFSLSRLHASRIPIYAWGALVSGRFGAHSSAIEDLDGFTVSGPLPFPVQVDGEPLAPVDRLQVEAGAGSATIIV